MPGGALERYQDEIDAIIADNVALYEAGKAMQE
jgi:hypothetical protein